MSRSEPAAGVVVVGAGLAGVTLARRLRGEGYGGSIAVLGDEDHQPYDRPPLSKGILAATVDTHQIAILEPDEAARLDIELRPGAAVAALDVERRRVVLGSGDELAYEHCVVATGSRVRRLPQVPDLTGVHYLRSLTDSLALRSALQQAQRLVVIGAGFIGLEVASIAVARGLSVTVIEREALPLTRVLGAAAGQLAYDLHTANGVDLRCAAGLAQIVPRADGAVGEVVLTDGTAVPADVVLVGAGAVPNVEWLGGSGLVVDDGVVCDGSGRSSAAAVWAVGDVARWPNSVTGLHARMEQWQSAIEQAGIVAHNIVTPHAPQTWDTVPYFWSDQFGTKIQFCGHPGERSRVMASPAGPVVAFGSEQLLTGVLTIGQPRVLALSRRLVAARGSWAELEALVSA